jgi:hypothetical protein
MATPRKSKPNYTPWLLLGALILSIVWFWVLPYRNAPGTVEMRYENEK